MTTEFEMDAHSEPCLWPEGFARICSNGVCNIYRIVHEQYPEDYNVCLGFLLDDFDATSNKTYGEPLIIDRSHNVHFLGAPLDYFAPSAPLWENVFKVVRAIHPDMGLLPTVRALEWLKELKHSVSYKDIDNALAAAIADYHQRRAHLVA